MVMTTNPGAVPNDVAPLVFPNKKETGVLSEGNHEEGAEEEEEADEDDYELEEQEVTMSLKDYESKIDDGSMLIFCDSCNIYRPSR